MMMVSQVEKISGASAVEISRWIDKGYLDPKGRQGKIRMFNTMECLAAAMAIEYQKIGFDLKVRGSLLKYVSSMTEDKLLKFFADNKTILIPWPCSAGVAWISRESLTEANPEFDGTWEGNSNLDVKAKYDKLKSMMEG
jgi:DNA-binding transcriptional MerR regulator